MATTDGRPRRFRAIWLAPLLALLALGAWVFASPIGSSPDDDFHLVSIWCANGGGEHCAPGESAGTRLVSSSLLELPCYAYDDTESAACQTTVLDTSSSEETKRGNFAGSYPPFYYSVMGLFSGEDILASAVLMRMLTVVLFVGLSTALFLLLPERRRGLLVWGWLATLVPLGLFLIASNNPSSWAIVGVGSAWLALLGYFETEGRRRVALGALFLLSVLMAAGARADAAFFSIGASVTVILLTARRGRGYLSSCIIPLVGAVIAVLFLLTAGQTGSGVGGFSPPPPTDGGASAVVESNPLSLLAYNILSLPELWTGVFGGWGLGWLDTQLPAIVLWGAAAVFVSVCFVGLAAMSWRKAIATTGTLLVLIALPLYVLYKSNAHVGAIVQARYFLPLIVILALVLLYVPAGRSLELSRLQRWAVILGLSVANFVALQVDIRRYVTGIDVPGLSLDSGSEWWWSGVPFSPNTVWLVGSLAFAALVVILIQTAGRSRSADVDGGSPSDALIPAR
jgi:hypothetical protein